MHTVGNIDDDAVQGLALAIRERARALGTAYVILDPDRDVVVSGRRQTFDASGPFGWSPVGAYTPAARVGDISADLICARDEDIRRKRA